jgi:hypothetical protein
VPDYKEMQSKSTDAVAAAIAVHLKNAAALVAAHTNAAVVTAARTASVEGGSINEAEIIARLDLLLAKLERHRAVPKGPAVEFPLEWVKLEKYVELSGDSVDSVQSRRKIGRWIDGNQCKIVNGRLWINLRAAQRWVEEWNAHSPSLASGRPRSNKRHG